MTTNEENETSKLFDAASDTSSNKSMADVAAEIRTTLLDSKTRVEFTRRISLWLDEHQLRGESSELEPGTVVYLDNGYPGVDFNYCHESLEAAFAACAAAHDSVIDPPRWIGPTCGANASMTERVRCIVYRQLVEDFDKSEVKHKKLLRKCWQIVQQEIRIQTSEGNQLNSKVVIPAAEFAFYRDGDGFRICGFGESGHFPNELGFGYLYALIAAGENGVAAANLISGNVQYDGKSAIFSESAAIGIAKGGQEIVDPTTKQSCENRLRKLIAERRQLERSDSPDRNLQLVDVEKEIEQFETYLASAIGLGGSSRSFDEVADKLRSRVHGAINRAVQKLESKDKPRLAAHFKDAKHCKEGQFYYQPPGSPPNWEISNISSP